MAPTSIPDSAPGELVLAPYFDRVLTEVMELDERNLKDKLASMPRRCEPIRAGRWRIARIVLLALAGRDSEAARMLRAAVRVYPEWTREWLPQLEAFARARPNASPACLPPRALSSIKPSPSGRLRLRESGNVARDNHLKSPLAVTGEKDRGRGNQDQASERIRLGDLSCSRSSSRRSSSRERSRTRAARSKSSGRVLIESGYLSEDQIGEALAASSEFRSST